MICAFVIPLTDVEPVELVVFAVVVVVVFVFVGTVNVTAFEEFTGLDVFAIVVVFEPDELATMAPEGVVTVELVGIPVSVYQPDVRLNWQCRAAYSIAGVTG